MSTKKFIAKCILYSGLAILFILGYLFPSSYDTLFRMLGIVVTSIGALLFLTFSKVRKKR